jgi:AcrR family transcriptional regulator
MPKILMTTDERREKAVKIGVKLARKVGAERVSMAKIAAEMKVSAPRLFHIFGTQAELAKAIKKAAKAEGVTLAVAEPKRAEVRAAAAATAPRKVTAKQVQAIKRKVSTPAVKPKAAADIKIAGKVVAKPAKLVKMKEQWGVEKGIAVAVKAKAPVVKPAPLKAPVKPAAPRAERVAALLQPKTPAEKFKALPKPFEASLAAVAPQA